MLRSPIIPLAAALAIGAALVLLLWPGVITYDGWAQYTQAVSGEYDDWHPPIMARLWSLARGAGLDGSGPMLAIQLALFWGGIALLAGALARAGARRAAWGALAVGLLPIALSWQMCVLKDTQLVGALAAASGLLAWYRLAGRRVPLGAAIAIAVLLAYAALLRANAAFTVAPLALAWLGWPAARRWPLRIALAIVLALGMVALSDPINHRLLGAERSHVERALPVFDLAGTAHFAHLRDLPGLPSGRWAAADARGCYTPFFWDALGDARRCGGLSDLLTDDRPDGARSIYGDWLAVVAAHPLAYAEHRIAHLNATLRIAAPAAERLANGPARSLPNRAGIGFPRRTAAAIVAAVAVAAAATPLGSPAWWLVVAGAVAWILGATPIQPARSLALAGLVSGFVQSASFAVVSIASDLRYHLWLLVWTPLAVVLLGACRGVPMGRVRVATGVAVVAALLSVLLRAAVHGLPG